MRYKIKEHSDYVAIWENGIRVVKVPIQIGRYGLTPEKALCMAERIVSLLGAARINHDRLRSELKVQAVLANENEETAEKLSDVWIFLDSVARGSWTDCCKANFDSIVDGSKRILRTQKAPGWKS